MFDDYSVSKDKSAAGVRRDGSLFLAREGAEDPQFRLLKERWGEKVTHISGRGYENS